MSHNTFSVIWILPLIACGSGWDRGWQLTGLIPLSLFWVVDGMYISNKSSIAQKLQLTVL